ncbi:DUF1905 domain-containing protein [Nocardioides sp. zg-DK7169]|uniref:DUF1905 domain-containing protein n=1 Tax=Nocardioides sp. zg-DK7169 TaxID=2736600 RepID=UPI0015546F28|nr:DUF1905 domain-containing protein [Nocardioides sp. zg-DK7169]NPC97535.1 DUF1905 domain-containing protein [Nocardioides sp. zg-DK7169]
MELSFSGELVEWRGPAPYHFVVVPPEECVALDEVAPLVSYGWGMVPVTLRVGGTEWTTALWPREGGYVVPVKDRVRRAEALHLGDPVHLWLRVDV